MDVCPLNIKLEISSFGLFLKWPSIDQSDHINFQESPQKEKQRSLSVHLPATVSRWHIMDSQMVYQLLSFHLPHSVLPLCIGFYIVVWNFGISCCGLCNCKLFSISYLQVLRSNWFFYMSSTALQLWVFFSRSPHSTVYELFIWCSFRLERFRPLGRDRWQLLCKILRPL